MPRHPFLLTAVLLTAVISISCYRATSSVATIHVPDMESPRDERIVTNAAVHEVTRMLHRSHDFYADVEKGDVVYHEGIRLRDRSYLTQLLTDLMEVGYPAEVTQVGRVAENSAAWQGHSVLWLKVPGMTSQADANRVAASLARTRLRGIPESVHIDRGRKTLTVQYDPHFIAPKNLEHAIANAGYAANDVPKYAGYNDAILHGYVPPWLR